jgi:carboxylesterase type B
MIAHKKIHRERGTVILIQQTIDSTMCNSPSTLDNASRPTSVPAMVETTESAASAVEEDEEEEYVDDVEKLIQDLTHSNNARVNAALDALNLDLDKDKEKCGTVTAWGSAALVRLLKDHLKKAIK